MNQKHVLADQTEPNRGNPVSVARGSTSGSLSRVSQAAAGSNCPLGDWGSGPATCFLGYSPRCQCDTSALLLPLVTKAPLGPWLGSRPYGLGTFVPSNVPMT